MRVEFEKEKVAIIQSDVGDFDNELGDWQGAFFKLLSLKNTFDFIYELTIKARRNYSAYLYIVVADGAKERTVDYLENLGYGNLKVSEGNVGVCEWVEEIDLFTIE